MKTLNANVLVFAAKTAPIAQQIKESLEEAEVPYEYTGNVPKAVDYILNRQPCLVVADAPTDDPRVLEFCKKIKKIKDDLPFELYFLIDDNKDFELQWNWFKNGVDEFGTRDTNVNLIIQRLQCILRPYRHRARALPQKGLVIDRERYMVYVDGREVALPRKEFELLSLLASKPEKVFTRDDIFRQIWGNKLIVGDRTIDVHIRKIREKIGDSYIVTVKGVGYKFQER